MRRESVTTIGQAISSAERTLEVMRDRIIGFQSERIVDLVDVLEMAKLDAENPSDFQAVRKSLSAIDPCSAAMDRALDEIDRALRHVKVVHTQWEKEMRPPVLRPTNND